MIEIVPEKILPFITEPCVLFFKDTKFDPLAPPHFYIVFPIPQKSLFITSIITSRTQKRINYYYRSNLKALESLIEIDQATFSFLSRPSAIDCNQSELLTYNDFIDRIDKDTSLDIKANSISKDLTKKIIEAISNSPLVLPRIKNLLKITYGKL